MEIIAAYVRAVLTFLVVGVAVLLLARAAGVWEPRQPHPCEIWQATDEGLDLKGCYAAFDAERAD